MAFTACKYVQHLKMTLYVHETGPKPWHRCQMTTGHLGSSGQMKGMKLGAVDSGHLSTKETRLQAHRGTINSALVHAVQYSGHAMSSLAAEVQIFGAHTHICKNPMTNVVTQHCTYNCSNYQVDRQVNM